MRNQDFGPQIIVVTRYIVITEIVITEIVIARTTGAPELGITYKRLLFADSKNNTSYQQPQMKCDKLWC